MGKPSSQGSASSGQHSIKNKSNAFSRKMRSCKSSMEFHLLPPDILRAILSRLSLKEAMRMSMLSREWRQLGICHPHLVFTKDTFFGSNITGNTNRARMIAEFITNVDNLLDPLWCTSTTTTTTIEKFAVKFGLRINHTHHIDRWVRFSIASRAKHISLDFTEGGKDSEDEKYAVRLCKLGGPNGSSVNSLDLAYVILKLPHSFCGITNLKKLSLHMVSISGSDLRCLLLSCALLECLSIQTCSLSRLSIRQELCRLQHLHVRECDLEMIELQAPNLATFEFDDYPSQIVLSESFNVLDATFLLMTRPLYTPGAPFKKISPSEALEYILTELPTTLPHVQKLFLRLDVRTEVQPPPIAHASFVNLRHLNLNLDVTGYPQDTSWVLWFVSFLELAPLLEELELHVGFFGHSGDSDSRTVTAVPGNLHHHLRIVYMTGFCAVVGIAELLLYILENATVLEHMVVDPVVRIRHGYRRIHHFHSASKASSSQVRALKDNTKSRIMAKEYLEREEFRHILTIL